MPVKFCDPGRLRFIEPVHPFVAEKCCNYPSGVIANAVTDHHQLKILKRLAQDTGYGELKGFWVVVSRNDD